MSKCPNLAVEHTTQYPMTDKPHGEQWWIGIKNWRRFSTTAKRRFAEFRRRNKPCRVVWFFSRVSPDVEEIKL